MKKDKKITLDNLATMVANGFEEINSKMATKEDLKELRGEMNTRFKEVDSRFNELEGKLGAYTSFWHRKFSEHEAWLQNLDKSVANLERHIGKK